MKRFADPDTLTLRRARARADLVDFLQIAAADEVQERLQEINKSFTDIVIVTPWPEVWEGRLDAQIIADEETLELAEGSADLVIHALSLHWANDPVGQLVQCRRALRPDGLLIATLFGGQTLHELRSAFAEAEIRVSGGLSPRIAPMGEVRELGGLLQRAGFALPVADVSSLSVTYPSPLHLMKDLRGMGETNVLTDRLKTFMPRDLLTEALSTYQTEFGMDDGRVPATFDVVTLTGWTPHASQQQPLTPGSASHRLADALGTDELDDHAKKKE